jgi:hypothetical protein
MSRVIWLVTFVQSPEDLEQVPVGKVRNIQPVYVPDSRENVYKLHVVNSDEIVQTRKVRNQIVPGLERLRW